MIPRKIHFVWLGSALPALYRQLIQRCRRFHPGWRAALLPPSTFLPVHYDQKHDLSHWMSQDLRKADAVHLWAHSWDSGGGDGAGELFSRVGAILLNQTYPAKSQP